MADVRYQRMLVLAIARSQRPAHLTAFKFFMISMESFSNVRFRNKILDFKILIDFGGLF